jgi:hypothetical protein
MHVAQVTADTPVGMKFSGVNRFHSTFSLLNGVDSTLKAF